MADRRQVAHLAAAVTKGFSAFHDVSSDGTAALTLGAVGAPATMPQGDGGRGQGALAKTGHLGQHCTAIATKPGTVRFFVPQSVLSLATPSPSPQPPSSAGQ